MVKTEKPSSIIPNAQWDIGTFLDTAMQQQSNLSGFCLSNPENKGHVKLLQKTYIQTLTKVIYNDKRTISQNLFWELRVKGLAQG